MRLVVALFVVLLVAFVSAPVFASEYCNEGCFSENGVKCFGATLQRCERDNSVADGCLRWTESNWCNSGESIYCGSTYYKCESGVWTSSLQGECTASDIQCFPDNSKYFVPCKNGWFDWNTKRTCDTGKPICVNEECGIPSCSGPTKADPNVWEVVQFKFQEGYGNGPWGDTCIDSGKKISDYYCEGTALKIATSVCSNGCVNGACVADGSICDNDNICESSAGETNANCPNDCCTPAGAKRCKSNTNKPQTCSNNNWVDATACASNEVCDGGSCKTSPTYCTKDAKECTDDNNFRTCKSDNTWGSATTCPTEKKYCDPVTKSCVACFKDSQCTSNNICSNKNVCVPKTGPTSKIVSPANGVKQEGSKFTVLVNDNMGSYPLSRCYYRTESQGTDTTLKMNTGYMLDVKTDDGKDDVLADDNCKDITYVFHIEGTPAEKVRVYWAGTNDETITGNGEITLSSCGQEAKYTLDGNGAMLREFYIGADGKGTDSITLMAQKTNPNNGKLLVNAYLYTLTDTSGKILARDSFSLYIGSRIPYMAARTCKGSFDVKTGTQCPDQSTQSICTVSVSSKDTAGQMSAETSGSYPIIFVSSKITEPDPTKSVTKSMEFEVTVKDEDFSGKGFDAGKCFYSVENLDSMGTWKTTKSPTPRTCGNPSQQKFKVTVGSGGKDCAIGGTDVCRIIVWAENRDGVSSLKNVLTLSIDFDKPVSSLQALIGWQKTSFAPQATDTAPSTTGLTCEYKVVSGTTTTKDWTSRNCNEKLTISIGTAGDCRDEGQGICKVSVRSKSNSGVQSDVASQSYDILLGDADTGLVVTSQGTDTGLKFIGTPQGTLVTFMICGKGFTMEQCKAAAAGSQCGTGKACLCKDSLDWNCDITCSSSQIDYFGLALLTGPKTVISQPQSATCPKTNVGEIQGWIDRFTSISKDLEILKSQAKIICDDPNEVDEKEKYCKRVDALSQAQKLADDHINWLKTKLSNPSTQTLSEVITRSQAVLDQIIMLMNGGEASSLKLEINYEKTGIVNQEITIGNTITLSGDVNMYAKVVCKTPVPGSSSDVFTSDSGCLDFSDGSNIIDFPGIVPVVPTIPPTGFATGRGIFATITGMQASSGTGSGSTKVKMYDAKFTPKIIGSYSAVCTLYGSFQKGCTSSFLVEKKTATISIASRLKSKIIDDEVTAPATAFLKLPNKISVTAENPDANDVTDIVTCTLTPPSGSTVSISSKQLVINGNGGKQIFELPFTPDVEGDWTLKECVLKMCDAGCKTMTEEGKWNKGLPIKVTVPTTLVITDLKPPTGAVVGQDAKITATVMNPSDSLYVMVSCDVSHGSSETLSSVCQYMDKPEIDKPSYMNYDIIFKPGVAGAWTINKCTIYTSNMGPDSNGDCPGKTSAWSMDNTGRTFTVSGATKLAITDVSDLGDQKVGDEATITVGVKNPTSIARWGKVTCTLMKGATVVNVESKDCRQLAATGTTGDTSSFELKKSFDLSDAGTWTFLQCKVDGSTDGCKTFASMPDSTLVKNTNFVVNGPTGLFITDNQAGIPKTVPKDSQGKFGIYVYNSRDTVYAKVSCTMQTDAGQKSGEGCAIAPKGETRVDVMFSADTSGIWKIESCSVGASSVQGCGDNPAIEGSRSNIGQFEVIRGDKLRAVLPFSYPKEVLIGEQAVISVDIVNPLAVQMSGSMACTFLKPDNTQVSSSSACLNFGKDGLAAAKVNAKVNIDIDKDGTWTITKCEIKGSYTQGCTTNDPVHYTSNGNNIGEFKVPAVPTKLTISGVSDNGATKLGSNMLVSVSIKNPMASPRWGKAFCDFEKPTTTGSTVVVTGMSDGSCTEFAAGESKILTVKYKLDKEGSWKIKSCRVDTSGSDCAKTGTVSYDVNKEFTVLIPSNIYIADWKLPNTVAKDNSAIIQVKINNMLSDNRFVKVSCILNPPGTTKTVSACLGVATKSEKWVDVTFIADSYGPWVVKSCKAESSLNSACDTNLQAQDEVSDLGSFEVIRGTKLTVGPFVFPKEANKGDQIKISTEISNPSAAELSGFLSCKFSAVDANHVFANISGCLTIRGDAKATAELFMTTNNEGIWNVEYCEVNGSLNTDCSQNSTHFSKKPVGTFTVHKIPVVDKDLTIADIRLPSGALKNEYAKVEVDVENPAEPRYALVTCKFKTMTATKVGTSQCALVNDIRTMMVDVKADELGKWDTLSCQLNASLVDTCQPSTENDLKRDIGSFTVSNPDNVFVSQVSASDAIIGSSVNILVKIENPLSGQRYAKVKCHIQKPSSDFWLGSTCQGVGAKSTQDFTLSTLANERGNWEVIACAVNASTSYQCEPSSLTHTGQGTKFVVNSGDKLVFSSGLGFPVTARNDTTVNITASVRNPSESDMFGIMNCTVRSPLQTITVSSPCQLIEGSEGTPNVKEFSASLHVDRPGTWQITSCNLMGSMDQSCDPASLHDSKAGGTISVTGRDNLFISRIAGKDVSIGSTVEITVKVENPLDTKKYGKVGCQLKSPAGINYNIPSSCLEVPAKSAKDFSLTMAANVLGEWNITSCFVNSSDAATCTPSVLSHSATGGTFGVVRADKLYFDGDIEFPASARNGSSVTISVFATNPTGQEMSAKMSCVVLNPAKQSRTISSDCKPVPIDESVSLEASLNVDRIGSWNISSCSLLGDRNSCNSLVQQDSRSNLGMIAVSVPSNLYISRISGNDVINGSQEDITVRVTNPISDIRRAKVSCLITKPSGREISPASGCYGISGNSYKDFSLSTMADEIGIWNIESCSVRSSTSTSCEPSSPADSLEGGTFEVQRGNKIKFASGISFSQNVQNDTVITFGSSARNPSASSQYVRMRCILLDPKGQNVVTNTSCLAIGGERVLALSASLKIDQVGGWQLVSCSLLGSLDDDCSSEELQDTNSTGGEFTSIGVQVNNLSISGVFYTQTLFRGDTANIRLVITNPNDFAQYANMRCAVRNPSGAEENLTSSCEQIRARGSIVLGISKIVNDVGKWNITNCSVYASLQQNCNGALLQDYEQIGTFEVVLPDHMIIREVSGKTSLNASLVNITATVENPLSDRKFGLVYCNFRSPSGINYTGNPVCTGLNTNELKNVTFPLYVNEVGNWSITKCSINASSSYDCAGSQLHHNITGGNFLVVRRSNLTLVSAVMEFGRVFNGTQLGIITRIRNPSETDLFGYVSCKMRVGTVVKQNSSSCDVFRKSEVLERRIVMNADVLGNWTGDSCIVYGTLDSGCNQTVQQHDIIDLTGSTNVTTIPDLYIESLEMSDGIARNTNGILGVRVRNDGVSIFASATCSIKNPLNATSKNSSGCVKIDPGLERIDISFFIDRLGSWSIFGCSINGSSNSSCTPSRLHNASNLTKNFSSTGKVLQIEGVVAPEGELKVDTKVEVVVTVRNIDNVLHKGFVNCSIRQPNNETRIITSQLQTIPVDDTRVFRPSFMPDFTGRYRLISCVVYRQESPAVKEDEKIIDRIFEVGLVIIRNWTTRCTLLSDCDGSDMKCFCADGQCQACPTGKTCKNHNCENIVRPQCSADVPCPQGYACQNNICVESTTGCDFDSECRTGFQCVDHKCVEKITKECTIDSQCSEGYVCSGSKCVKQGGEGDNMVGTLLIILVIAGVVAVAIFFIIRKRVVNKDLFSEIERAKTIADKEKEKHKI